MRIISGEFKSRVLVTPKGIHTRPTSEKLRGSFFNICQGFIEEAFFLDLFAGSGAMGIEAISRGASRSTFVESDRESIQCILANVNALNIKDKTTVLKGDVFDQMEKLIKRSQQFDIIFADPPYDTLIKYQGELISFSSCVVKIVDTSSLLKDGGMLFVEDSKTAQPLNLNLQTLEYKNSREMGRSALQQYQKKFI